MSYLSIIVTFAIVSVIFAKKARQLRLDGKQNRMLLLIGLYIGFAMIACAASVFPS